MDVLLRHIFDACACVLGVKMQHNKMHVCCVLMNVQAFDLVLCTAFGVQLCDFRISFFYNVVILTTKNTVLFNFETLKLEHKCTTSV